MKVFLTIIFQRALRPCLDICIKISNASIKEIQNELTNFECEVFDLKVAGFDNNEIEEILEKDLQLIRLLVN